FFFQAEDGIRDKLVTGVQTCALPIYPGAPPAATGAARSPSRTRAMRRPTTRASPSTTRVGSTSPGGRRAWALATTTAILPTGPRSEERRVGKECRGGVGVGRRRGDEL